MIDREEALRITAFLSKQELKKDVVVGERKFKAGRDNSSKHNNPINRFALRNIVSAYSAKVQKDKRSRKTTL